MNVKADRIESIIQVLNRNLLLVLSGDLPTAVSNPERRSLKRVDTGVFSSDRFAYEMLEFFKSHRKRDAGGESAVEAWERQFMRGLELLLCECVVVKDEVERECFISRVYAWFMEKLVERKSLDNVGGIPRGSELSNFDVGPSAKRKNVSADGEWNQTAHSGIKVGDQLYVKHSFPKISGAQSVSRDNNFGMLYHEPTTEAEIEMNELWLAKRQQEIFETKAQQQLNVALDRMSLQKSRIESEALRRTETASFLAAVFEEEHLRQSSPPQQRPYSSNLRPLSSENSRFAPIMKRPISGKKQYKAAMDAGYNKLEELAHRFASGEASDLQDAIDSDGLLAKSASTTTVITVKKGTDGGEEEVSINRPRRGVVEKPVKAAPPPMRFKNTAPEGLVAKRQKEHKLIMDSFLQDYDSDDDGSEDAHAGGAGRGGESRAAERATSAPLPQLVGVNKSGGGTSLALRESMRDRPVSAHRFKELSVNDNETKVLYRYSTFRRMPLNAAQEVWLQSREDARIKEAVEALKARSETKSKSGAKGKGKGKKSGGAESKGEAGSKGKKGGGNDKAGKSSKVGSAGKKSGHAGAAGEAAVKKKYKSASEFMGIHFPQFDEDDQEDCIGPLRAEQLDECNKAASLLSAYNVSSAVVRRALLIPQDRPEAICLENAKDSVEGLMVNPIPREFWRSGAVKSAAKKAKKSGKKKK